MRTVFFKFPCIFLALFLTSAYIFFPFPNFFFSTELVLCINILLKEIGDIFIVNFLCVRFCARYIMIQLHLHLCAVTPAFPFSSLLPTVS